MSGTDIVILIIVVILLSAIIFFSFVYPKLKGRSGVCSNCPAATHIKRVRKKIEKERKKDKKTQNKQ